MDIETVIDLVSDQPCASAVALITLLEQNGSYPPPMAIQEQYTLIMSLTEQTLHDWDVVLDQESSQIQDKCLQSEVDFDFLLDSSSSVGSEYWDLMMNFIGDIAIKKYLLPIGSKQCGNHIAGRWFSERNNRFYDFDPPRRNQYHPKTYAEYVGDKFIAEPYHSGGTNTARALYAVRSLDVPTGKL